MIYVIMLFAGALYGCWVFLQLLMLGIGWLSDRQYNSTRNERIANRGAKLRWFFWELSFVDRFRFILHCLASPFVDFCDGWNKKGRDIKYSKKFRDLNQEYYDYTGCDFNNCFSTWEGDDWYHAWGDIMNGFCKNEGIYGFDFCDNGDISPLGVDRERQARITWRPSWRG